MGGGGTMGVIRTATVARGEVQAVVPHTVFGVVQQVGDPLGSAQRGEDFGEEATVVAAAGFEDELAGCCSLYISVT